MAEVSNRVFSKLVIHPNIIKNHKRAIISLGAKIESEGSLSSTEHVIRFSATSKRYPSIVKFYQDRKIMLQEYTPKSKVFN